MGWRRNTTDYHRGTTDYHRGKDLELRVEKYSFQVLDIMNDNIEQQALVWQLRLQELLLETKNQELVLISTTSASQWTDKSDESNIA